MLSLGIYITKVLARDVWEYILKKTVALNAPRFHVFIHLSIDNVNRLE